LCGIGDPRPRSFIESVAKVVRAEPHEAVEDLRRVDRVPSTECRMFEGKGQAVLAPRAVEEGCAAVVEQIEKIDERRVVQGEALQRELGIVIGKNSTHPDCAEERHLHLGRRIGPVACVLLARGGRGDRRHGCERERRLHLEPNRLALRIPIETNRLPARPGTRGAFRLLLERTHEREELRRSGSGGSRSGHTRAIDPVRGSQRRTPSSRVREEVTSCVNELTEQYEPRKRERIAEKR